MFARRGRLVTAAVAMAALVSVAGCATSSPSSSGSPVTDVSAAPSSPFGGDLIDPPYAKPAMTLLDTAGKPYNFDTRTAGRLTLLYFGYTHCPDVCPTTMATLAAALRELSPTRRARVTVVFVSTDPTRDTPAVLRTWLGQFDPSFVGLTGSFTVIQQAAAKLGVSIQPPVKLPGGGYTVTHGAEVIAFDTDNKAHVIYTAGVTVAQYARYLPMLLAGDDMRAS